MGASAVASAVAAAQGRSRPLAALKATFILSIDDAPETRAIFRAFDIEAVEWTCTRADGDSVAAKEMNVTPPGLPRAADRQRGLFDEGDARARAFTPRRRAARSGAGPVDKIPRLAPAAARSTR
jgi:hypothetical protein